MLSGASILFVLVGLFPLFHVPMITGLSARVLWICQGLVLLAVLLGLSWLYRHWHFVLQWVEYLNQFESIESLAEATFDRSPVPMAVVEDGRPIMVNQRLTQFLQRTSEELKEMHFRDLTHPDDYELDADLYGQLLEGELDGDFYQIQKRYIRPEGSVAWALLHVALLNTGDGKSIAVVQDVDQQVKLTQQLQNKVQDLEDFGSALSHEIKEPVRTLGIRLEMFRDSVDPSMLDQKARQNFEYLVDATERLRKLVRDLLRYGGSLSNVFPAPGQVDVAVKWAIDSVEGLKEEHIHRHYPPGISLPLSEEGLERIVGNLLSNAWKFRSPHRPLQVDIGIEETKTSYVFYVQDNGAGIDHDFRKNAFDMFSRGKSDVEGTGVGLAICRRIIESVLGTIEVEDSSTGHGVRITCTIPRTST